MLFEEVNFKILSETTGEFLHVYSLSVIVSKFYLGDEMVYSVFALTYGEVPFLSIKLGITSEEAFNLVEKISKKYPVFGDKRDYNIEYSPLFDMEVINEH